MLGSSSYLTSTLKALGQCAIRFTFFNFIWVRFFQYHKEVARGKTIPFLLVLFRFFFPRAGDLAVRFTPRLEET